MEDIVDGLNDAIEDFGDALEDVADRLRGIRDSIWMKQHYEPDSKVLNTYHEWSEMSRELSYMVDLTNQAHAAYLADPCKKNAEIFIDISQKTKKTLIELSHPSFQMRKPRGTDRGAIHHRNPHT